MNGNAQMMYCHMYGFYLIMIYVRFLRDTFYGETKGKFPHSGQYIFPIPVK